VEEVDAIFIIVSKNNIWIFMRAPVGKNPNEFCYWLKYFDLHNLFAQSLRLVACIPY